MFCSCVFVLYSPSPQCNNILLTLCEGSVLVFFLFCSLSENFWPCWEQKNTLKLSVYSPAEAACARGRRCAAASSTRGWPGWRPSQPAARCSWAAAPQGGRWPGSRGACSPSRPSPSDSSSPPGHRDRSSICASEQIFIAATVCGSVGLLCWWI